jgi:S-DNA-T family DNA segregation ATPase FtsK/SpoIIIE
MKSKVNPTKKTRQFDKHYKVISILLLFFAFLLLLALISYTKFDEENSKVSISELFGLLSGDPIIEAKAATTRNWLGLVGAWLSFIFYNKTVGFAFLPFPLFIIAWSRYLFTGKKVSNFLIKYTSIYLIVSILFSGLMGSLNTLPTLSDISKEWSGSVGQFLASAFTGLLGSIGSIILFIFAILITFYLGTDFKILDFLKSMNNSLIEFFARFKKDKDKNEDDEEEQPFVNPVQTAKNNLSALKDIKYKQEAVVNENSYDIDLNDGKIIEPKDESPEPANMITRKPTIIINKNFPKDINNQQQNANPFVINKTNAAVENENIAVTEEKTLKVEPEVIPEFKPNFKNVKDEVYSSLDVENSNLNIEINKKIENENIDKLKEIDKVIEKEELAKPIEIILEKKNTVAQPEPIPEKKIEFQIPNSIDLNPNIIQTEKTVLEPEIENQKTLKVILNKPNPETKEPIFLIGTAIHDQEINYTFPGLDLLINEKSHSNVDDEELRMNAQILQEKLETFKIYIENLSVTPGPVVTQYEFVPAAGIKISKIESLSDDLAMALKAKGIRIIAPIPGKGTIGVEIPNANPCIVRFAETVESPKFLNSDAKLPLVMGKTISGEIHIVDLAKMPHLLIAGSTGSGKSVGINTIIASLVYKLHPSELKFVIIDPKKVELQSYSKLKNHYMAASPEVQDTIVTKPEDAVIVLKAAVAEMELRYDILASVRQRNIADYNQKIKAGAFKDIADMAHKQMPYIVVIIDELADLMLTASKEIEEPITRLAQMARAVGIHLVVATQRPSVDVITGIIKANFPARIAYLVASKIDSRTILDMQGAEQLLGQGDMLCLPPGSPKPVRIQNSFISTDEVENICEFIGVQKGYSEPYYLPSLTDKSDNQQMYNPGDRDPLFEDAARLIVRHQQGSVSLIQRRLKVGYARAGRIVDELENAGVIGPFDGSKARLVLMESEADLERIL